MAQDSNPVIVIGSGPAAFGACLALIAKGIKPVVIDLGLTHDSATDIEQISASSAAKKKRFGQGHMYAIPTNMRSSFSTSGDIPVSSAFGGLSTVWGTNIQGYGAPSQNPTLRSYWPSHGDYKQILEQIQHTGQRDALEEIFKWPIEFRETTQISERSKKFLDKAHKVAKNRLILGMARNATSGTGTRCKLNGTCLTGCPNNAPFSTEEPFANWIQKGLVEYIQGEVTKILELGDVVRLEFIDNSGSQKTISGSRVFVCAGSLASLVLARKSNLLAGSVQEVHDTQVVYLPFFSLLPASKNKFRLAQIFVESIPHEKLEESFHFSLYETDASFKARAEILFPTLAKFVPSVLYSRILAGIGFLSSSHSGVFQLASSTKKNDELKLTQITSGHSKIWTILHLVPKLLPLVKIGLVPILPLLVTPNVGASYHVGVLKDDKGKLLLDNLARVNPTSRTHFADGLSLPHLPAGPVTLTVMANAFRIAMAGDHE